MSKHTPGPWLIVRNGKAGHTYRIWRNNHGGKLSPKGKNEGWASVARYVTGEANARLIAAAPDLLAECRATATMLRASPIAVHPWVAERIAALDAAIALAEKGGA